MIIQEAGYCSSISRNLLHFAINIFMLTCFFLLLSGMNSQAQSSETIDAPLKIASADSGGVEVSVSQDVVVADGEEKPFPETGPLVDCELFTTVNSVGSLMSWSNHYHQQIIAAQHDEGRAQQACRQTIVYRGRAHCKEPNNSQVRQALLETLTLCRSVGLEWEDIEHSTNPYKR